MLKCPSPAQVQGNGITSSPRRCRVMPVHGWVPSALCVRPPVCRCELRGGQALERGEQGRGQARGPQLVPCSLGVTKCTDQGGSCENTNGDSMAMVWPTMDVDVPVAVMRMGGPTCSYCQWRRFV